jgi:polysaccharide biosynthesis/export protein
MQYTKISAFYSKHQAFVLFFISVSLMQLIACAPKQASYFQGNTDTSKIRNIDRKEAIIQKNDILSITVFSDDPTASAIYNQPVLASGGAGGASTAGGYLVNELGDIYFQGLGKLHVEGLTKVALIDLLNEKLKDQLKNPYYAIRFLNYKITVEGEVNRGGEFNIPNERVTILEAIALAGDMTIYAKKKEVLVVRELNGKREIARVDVTSQDIFNSPYYYMQQNDLVIVEASKKPSAAKQETVQNIGLAASIISAIAIVIAIFRR